MGKDNTSQCGSLSTRRRFLQSTVATTAGYLTTPWNETSIARARAANKAAPEARLRLDLLDENSPPELEVVQLTSDPKVPASHLYMEAQIFTMDSQRFVLHRSATAHGGRRSDLRHQYLRCDLDDNCSLHPLTDELGVTAASISPDGKYVYYFVDETEPDGGRLTLKRVRLDGTERETVLVVDSPLPDTNFRPSRPYPLSTISSDGQRLAISAFLGDGQTVGAPFGLMVFDLQQGTVHLVLHGTSWCNMHPQYCRSLEPEASHDILVQENHGNVATATGEITRLTGGGGADIHVICDNGSNFRNLPWGRDGNEFCQGHQCWRGRTRWAITSTSCRDRREAQLIEGQAALYAGHVGIRTPGHMRNDLTRNFPSPHFYHFATDIQGKRLVSDAGPLGKDASIYLAHLGEAGSAPASQITYLLKPQSTCDKTAHIHPFLSPDGSKAFFNSDESGILQAYMIRGLENC
jgi:hypothetical protein